MATAPKSRAQQVLDLVAGGRARQALLELDLDEADEQGIERPAGGEELLGDLGEGTPAADHAAQRQYLPTGPLDMPDRGVSVDRGAAHDDTKAAPVMPAVA